MNRYRLLYRPASFCTLPPGLEWKYVKPPGDLWVNRYGVIETKRPLTAEEMRTFEIEPVK